MSKLQQIIRILVAVARACIFTSAFLVIVSVLGESTIIGIIGYALLCIGAIIAIPTQVVLDEIRGENYV